MSFRRAINLFPWDAQAEGPAACLGTIAGLGCNAVVLSPNYHRARLFRPRWPGHYSRPVDWCDFRPDRAAYAEPDLLPPLNPDAGCVAATGAAVQASRAQGLELLLSVIGCHNTTLGLAHPELTVENACGDRHAFALCPAQPRVQAHLASLVRDLARQFRPDGLVLDSFSHLDAVHREHHELMFVSPGAAGKHLLSLCFCPSCRDDLAREGVDPARFRDEVRTFLDAALHRPPLPRAAEWERDELASLLLEWHDLLSATRARAAGVERLLTAVAAAARAEQVPLHLHSGLLARPSARAWSEGLGLRARARFADQLFIQAHFGSAREVLQDLGWAATLLPAARLMVATMTGEDQAPTEADLRQRAEGARELGAAGICYYNYGLLSPARLAWIRRANAAVT